MSKVVAMKNADIGSILNLGAKFQLAKEAFLAGHYKTANIHTAHLQQKVIESTKIISSNTLVSPKYSIIVVNYKASDDFVNALEFLKKYENSDQWEIIVVNNGNDHLIDVVSATLSKYKIVDIGFNFGCSGGRNVGAHYASGEYLLFVDDDGVLSEFALEALVECIQKYDAVTCRGKVLPRTENSISGGNYDKGSSVTVSIPDAEGISIWRHSTFKENGGFDVLLSGHEGLCLCSKIFRFFGPVAFLYAPEAILYHDYAKGSDHEERKKRLHQNNRKYLDYLGISWAEINKTLKEAQNNDIVLRKINSHHRAAHYQKLKGINCKISVITTAKNGAKFIEDYVASLKNQTYQNFHIIFVDDGSEDDTADKLQRLWNDNKSLTLIKSEGVGRSGALNLALNAADTDICLIADVDDVSIESRFEKTVRYFVNNPLAGCVSFYCFNEESVMRAAKPFVPYSVSLKDRALVGMPASFPTFAFKLSEFEERFDEELSAGVDCDWIYRNFKNGASDGHMVPMSLTYYRIHDQQITFDKRDLQKNVALSCVEGLHESILGEMTDTHRSSIALLSGWERIETGQQVDELLHYINKLSSKLVGDEPYVGNSPEEYLYLTWNLMRFEITKRDYRSWRNTAINLKSTMTKNGSAPKAPLAINHQVQKILSAPSYGIFGWRKFFVYVLMPFVKIIAPKSGYKKYCDNPVDYLMSLKSKKYIWVRRLLFPQ